MQTLTTETPDGETARGPVLAAEMCTAAELVHRYGEEIRLTALRLTRSEVADWLQNLVTVKNARDHTA